MFSVCFFDLGCSSISIIHKAVPQLTKLSVECVTVQCGTHGITHFISTYGRYMATCTIQMAPNSCSGWRK